MMQRGTLLAATALAAAAATVAASPQAASRCTKPPITRPGLRPATVVTYDFVGGNWKTPAEIACAERGILAWNLLNQGPDGSGVVFVRVAEGQAPAVTVNRLVFGSNLAGNTTAWQFDTDGYAVGFAVQVTADRGLISLCEALAKVVAHEFGHGQGLGHLANARAGASIMNQLDSRNDQRGNLPAGPTACDQAAVATASRMPRR